MAAKKEDRPLPGTPDTDVQADELTALRSQMDQVLDFMAEQQTTIDTLKAAAGANGASAQVVQRDDVTAQFDAELEALKLEFADDPAIQVFERRVLEGKDAGTEIRLRDEVPVSEDPQGTKRIWKLRWFNLGKEGRAQQAIDEGYVKVRWTELENREAVVADDKSGEFVRKGERGYEVLYKMRLKLFDYKKRRDAANRAGLLASESRMRDHVANGVAARADKAGMNSDQAGSFAHQGLELTIKEGQRETITL